MTVFDLLFIGIFLGSVGVVLMMAVNLLRGRFKQAARLLELYGIGLTLYLGVVVTVSLVSAPRILAVGERRCFDDWCIAVENIERSEKAGDVTYSAHLKMFNQAQRVSQREHGVVVYLLDQKGQRFNATQDPSAAPFDSLLQPGDVISTTRSFSLTGAVGQPVLVLEHEGFSRFPGMFIIGDDSSLFHKPTIVELPQAGR